MMGFIKRRVHSTKDFMKSFALTSSINEHLSRMIFDLVEMNPQFKVNNFLDFLIDS
jgi:hypothetical protein